MPTLQLYREYSKDNIRLSICNECGEVVDKYIEYEFVLVALHLILLKTQAYRHLLYNREPSSNPRVLLKTSMLSICIDACMQWVFIHSDVLDKRAGAAEQVSANWGDSDLQLPMLTTSELSQLFLRATLGLVAYCTGIAAVVFIMGMVYSKNTREHKNHRLNWRLNRGDGRRLLLVSLSTGFSRLMVVLVMIWRFDYSFIVIATVLVQISNVQAVRAFLQQPCFISSGNTTASDATPSFGNAYWHAVAVVCVGLIFRLSVRLLTAGILSMPDSPHQSDRSLQVISLVLV